jgi:hypothetical protein
MSDRLDSIIDHWCQWYFRNDIQLFGNDIDGIASNASVNTCRRIGCYDTHGHHIEVKRDTV